MHPHTHSPYSVSVQMYDCNELAIVLFLGNSKIKVMKLCLSIDCFGSV